MNYKLPAQTSIGQIELTIRDLERSLNFYTRVVGLELLTRKFDSATLGTEKSVLLK